MTGDRQRRCHNTCWASHIGVQSAQSRQWQDRNLRHSSHHTVQSCNRHNSNNSLLHMPVTISIVVPGHTSYLQLRHHPRAEDASKSAPAVQSVPLGAACCCTDFLALIVFMPSVAALLLSCRTAAAEAAASGRCSAAPSRSSSPRARWKR